MSEQKKVFRSDYKKPDFTITNTNLEFIFFSNHVEVNSQLLIRRQSQKSHLINLDGKCLELKQIHLNESPLSNYTLSSDFLTFSVNPDENEWTLKTKVWIYPDQNTALEGLYKSENNFFTQCEPQGFRRITYFFDRPDVMSAFEVKIIGNKKQFPFLLSNGNLIESYEIDENQVNIWNDPHLKPCYLFALVAGKFDVLEKTYLTSQNNNVLLQAYVPVGKKERAHFALDSLIKAMKWDEARYNLCYDLDRYMIVSTDDFNAGAMENKGLNIFNSRLILADETTTTDENFYSVESVVAHEYFHNWSGNRVTLRDWFNLSLKEGLTVFRDQEFSMSEHSPSLVRIDSVSTLKKRQFSEDESPNAHPIYPLYGYSVDNFFTATIYEKGAEVIRMIQTLLGRPDFDIGLKKYFQTFDGQAVTIEDFASILFETNKEKLNTLPGFTSEHFKLWYTEAGTPHIKVTEEIKKEGALSYLTLTLEQSRPKFEPAPPLLIPLQIGVYDSLGHPLEINHPLIYKNSEGHSLIILNSSLMSLDIPIPNQEVYLSFNQFFSSPIKVFRNQKPQNQKKLFQFDKDPFNKWDVIQTYLSSIISDSVLKEDKTLNLDEDWLSLLSDELKNRDNLDPHWLSTCLTLPDTSYLIQIIGYWPGIQLESKINQLKMLIATHLKNDFWNIYEYCSSSEDLSFSGANWGKRKLKFLALSYLSQFEEGKNQSYKEMLKAKSMNNLFPSFKLCLEADEFRNEAKDLFFNQWKDDTLVLNNWFSGIAASHSLKTSQDIKDLWTHPSFTKTNPNRIYSLLGLWGSNLFRFHEDSNNYHWMAEKCLELDKVNPQTATRIGGSFNSLIYLKDEARSQAFKALQTILNEKTSNNLYDVISRIHSSLDKGEK